MKENICWRHIEIDRQYKNFFFFCSTEEKQVQHKKDIYYDQLGYIFDHIFPITKQDQKRQNWTLAVPGKNKYIMLVLVSAILQNLT